MTTCNPLTWWMQAGYNIKPVCFECQHYIWEGRLPVPATRQLVTWNIILWLIYAIHRVATTIPIQLGSWLVHQCHKLDMMEGFPQAHWCTPVPPYCYVRVFGIHPNYMVYDTLQYMGFVLGLWLSQAFPSLKYGFIHWRKKQGGWGRGCSSPLPPSFQKSRCSPSKPIALL